MIPNHPLKLLVIGSGGREHALCWKLAQSKHVGSIHCAPGNGGTGDTAKTCNINIDVMDFSAIIKFCLDKQIDLVVVGPENPLAVGLADLLHQNQIRVFGPVKNAAQLEWSKAYTKDFLQSAGISTARYKICTSFEEGQQFVRSNDWARVVKVDGLVFGKGVFVCDNESDTIAALSTIFKDRSFGEAGNKVILEEKLQGEEISLVTLCDGKKIIPFLPSQDHKRRFDGDLGPNTGGMGVFAPIDLYQKCQAEISNTILNPLEQVIRNGIDGQPFQGVLYIGLMMVRDSKNMDHENYKPYVLEFNARFGDPETQATLPLMTSDLLPALWACTNGTLDQVKIEWSTDSSCCVVAVGEQYPQSSSKGVEISIGEIPPNISVFHAGTSLSNNKLVTNGGRILSVTALGPSLDAAADKAYAALKNISFNGIAYRTDIGRRRVASCQ